MAALEALKLYFDISNEDYHAVDPDNFAVSSSQLKDIFKDPDTFFKKYIEKSVPGPTGSALDIGNYVHTALLEPLKLSEEYTVYPVTRRGEAWDTFQAANAGKIILSKGEHAQADRAIHGLKNSPRCMEQLTEGHAEVSLFVDVRVDIIKRVVFAEIDSVFHYLHIEGWRSCDCPTGWEDMTKLRVKVRADFLKYGEVIKETGEIIYGSINDIKTFTGDPKDYRTIKEKVRGMSLYDLSAAMYLDCYNAYSLSRQEVPFGEFHWQFADKGGNGARNWVASEAQIQVGRGKWRRALIELATAMYYKWTFEEKVNIVDIESWETKWLEDEKPVRLKARPEDERELKVAEDLSGADLL